MSTQIMNGARAMIGFMDQGTPTFIGIFNNVSYGVTYDVSPAFILGRYSAAATDYVGQEMVNISVSGYRVIDSGPHSQGGGRLPTLQELLNHQYITIAIVDRKDPSKKIAQFNQVRPTGYSTSISARQLEEIQMTFVATHMDDETTLARGGNSEEATTQVKFPAPNT